MGLTVRDYCPGQTFCSSFWKLSQLFTEVLGGAPKYPMSTTT